MGISVIKYSSFDIIIFLHGILYRGIPFTYLLKFQFIHILSYIYLSNNHLFFTYPLRELIFGHYILSFSLSYHTSSGITQITFLNASSKSPYKQMQFLTRNNHITSNHLPLLLFTTSKDIFIRIFSIGSSVFLQQCKHCCLHQNHISVQPYIKDTRFAGALRCLRANSTHLHFAFTQKIERAAKSATLPYAFYIFEVLIFSFVVWFTRIYPIRPINLFQQHHSHKLMWESHF